MNWHRFTDNPHKYINLDKFELITIYDNCIFFYRNCEDREPNLQIQASEFKRRVDFDKMINSLQRQLEGE